MPNPSGLRCPACDYDLTGLTKPQCPECGLRLVVSDPSTVISLTIVALRITAIWLLIIGIGGQVSAVVYALGFMNEQWDSKILLVITAGNLYPLASIICGGVLWFNTRRLARRITDLPVATGAEMNVRHQNLLASGLILLGIFVCIDGFRDCAIWLGQIASLVFIHHKKLGEPESRTFIAGIAGFIKGAIGMVMVIRWRGIIWVIHRLRRVRPTRPD